MFIEKGFGASLSSKNFLATSKQPNGYSELRLQFADIIVKEGKLILMVY
jgi:hypothetical protein